jgi:hypothetical protein
MVANLGEGGGVMRTCVLIVLLSGSCVSEPIREGEDPMSYVNTVDSPNGHFIFSGTRRPSQRFEDILRSEVNMHIGYLVSADVWACTDITFLQAYHIVRKGMLHFIDPSAEARGMGGWTIDQAPGNPQPWYPLNPDGTYNPLLGTQGNNTTSPMTESMLGDKPGAPQMSWPMTFEFVSCPVCRAGTCVNQIFDCVYWTFTLNEDGTISMIDAHNATMTDTSHFDDAVRGWNMQAGGALPNGPAGQLPIPPLTH